MRKEFCERDNILITYTENDVCFEDCKTAESVLFANDGKVIHSNYDADKTEHFKEYLSKIYPVITSFRVIDSMKTV